MFTWSWRLTKVSLRELHLCLVSCATFQRNQCNISLKTTKVNLVVVQEGMSGDHHSEQASPSKQDEFLYKLSWIFIQYLLIYFSLDQSDGTNLISRQHITPTSLRWLVSSVDVFLQMGRRFLQVAELHQWPTFGIRTKTHFRLGCRNKQPGVNWFLVYISDGSLSGASLTFLTNNNSVQNNC